MYDTEANVAWKVRNVVMENFEVLNLIPISTDRHCSKGS